MSEEKFDISFDDLNSLYEEAEVLFEQATSFSQTGKFSSFTIPKIWDGDNFQDVDVKTWRSHNGFKFLELNIEVDVKEFNPESQYDYKRRVQVKRAPWNKKLDDGTYEKVPSTWFAIWEPSVKSVVPNYKNMVAALRFLQGKYVKVLDVLQQPTKSQPEPTYRTCKLDKVYSSREEAYVDSDPLKGKSDTKAEYKFSEELVNGVNKMYSEVGITDPGAIAAALGGLTADDVKEILGVE